MAAMIVVVDAHPAFVGQLTALLTEAGYRAVGAIGRPEAARPFSGLRESPALAVIDFIVQDTTGPELIGTVKTRLAMTPSGPYIGQTSGHGDFRGPNEVPENRGTPLDYLQRVGHTSLADGVPEVLKRTREILRMGASQIKAMAGGGVSSLYDPLDVAECTFEEAKAICHVAKRWNTYVMIHAFTEARRRRVFLGCPEVLQTSTARARLPQEGEPDASKLQL